MASGVPEHEVWAAADAVLARGERPTVERVRTELGRGSPARVGQLLEQWWEQLAQRLKGHALLPELPGEVAQAFTEAWRLALAHADTTAQAALAEEHNRLFAEQTTLTQERKLWEIALAEAKADLTESANKLAQAELQGAERQGLIDRLAAEVADVRQQRDHLQAQLEHRQTELNALRAEHATVQAHIRTVEDRTHQQVDLARQEVKALSQQQERVHREHTKRVNELTAQRDALQTAVRAAEQTAAHQAGQIAALEATINQWRRTQTTGTKRVSHKTPSPATSKVRERQKKATR
ncbi:DNA-binding protein [Dyella lutea]|uniref:DNA-binding protein n=1 Tax=Dyella lutea TaxID=2950441 RepID=A0ABT1FDH6_9GAMM|nr:DNA-binding protein [Dyella lutea]MCP1375155.1 DNA-binding protein [Dyella lutea]